MLFKHVNLVGHSFIAIQIFEPFLLEKKHGHKSYNNNSIFFAKFYQLTMTIIRVWIDPLCFGIVFLVCFVDYGNEELTEKCNIRHINQELLKIPAQAFRCSINNIIPLGNCIKLNNKFVYSYSF